MSRIKKITLRYAPYWLQDAAVGWYNACLYRQRHVGRYGEMREYFADLERVFAGA